MSSILETAKTLIAARTENSLTTDFLILGKTSYESANTELNELTGGQVVKAITLYGVTVVVVDAVDELVKAGVKASNISG